MFRSLRLGSALGIPLFLHTSFFILPLVVLYLDWEDGLGSLLFAEALLVTVFGCVLLHELGHAMMARYFGIPTRDITLYPIGGIARLESMGSTPFQEVCIALAGPAVNLAIVLLLTPAVAAFLFLSIPIQPQFALEQSWTNQIASFVSGIWASNLALMIFNLIPVFPMDGGRVFRAILASAVGPLRATEVATAIGLVLGLGLSMTGFWLGSPSMGIVPLFVVMAGRMELRALRQREEDRKLLELPPSAELLEPGWSSQPAPFSGFVWDRNQRVWVRWVNGRPVEVL
ncbi:MAG: site-2 protease family protein [Gemmataceae bacterium]